ADAEKHEAERLRRATLLLRRGRGRRRTEVRGRRRYIPLRTRWTRRRRRRVRRHPGRRRGAVLRFEAERRRRRTALGEGRLGLRRLETGRRGFDLVRPRVGGAIDVERGERHGLAVDFDVGTHALRRLDVDLQLRDLGERGVERL